MPRRARKHVYAVHFGTLVHELRLERRWTLRYLARLTNLNPAYLGVLESGGNIPSIVTLFWLGQAFNLAPSTLLRTVEDRLRADEVRRQQLPSPSTESDPPES
jgi:transcriptional regulator with XRE-family HTH domain